MPSTMSWTYQNCFADIANIYTTYTLALTYPTIITYVVDTDRCKNPNTFMSNMLYALSIMYKSRLPMVVAFNKIDICSHLMLVDWMKDYSAFQKAIQKEETYRADLSHSMSLVLDEFYKTLCCCGVSAMTGAGMKEYEESLKKAFAEYNRR